MERKWNERQMSLLGDRRQCGGGGREITGGV